MKKVLSSAEDYLEAIVMLGGTTEVSVRSVDIARELDVSKASVSKAITLLKERGLVTQPFYGDITLTEEGFDLGQSVLERHHVLTRFLVEMVGIDEETAEDEACKMEHAISDASFEKWKAFISKISE